MLVQKIDAAASLNIRGELSFSCGFGAIRFAFNRFGLFNPYAGIYQRKKTLKGWRLSKMAFYRVSNPRTSEQQSWRAIFSAGWVAYAALTSDQKKLYTLQARRYRMSGPNLFMREWLRSH